MQANLEIHRGRNSQKQFEFDQVDTVQVTAEIIHCSNKNKQKYFRNESIQNAQEFHGMFTISYEDIEESLNT